MCVYRGLFKSRQAAKIPPIEVILPVVVECVHMYMNCLRINMAGCFSEFFRLL